MADMTPGQYAHKIMWTMGEVTLYETEQAIASAIKEAVAAERRACVEVAREYMIREDGEWAYTHEGAVLIAADIEARGD